MWKKTQILYLNSKETYLYLNYTKNQEQLWGEALVLSRSENIDHNSSSFAGITSCILFLLSNQRKTFFILKLATFFESLMGESFLLYRNSIVKLQLGNIYSIHNVLLLRTTLLHLRNSCFKFIEENLSSLHKF